VKDLLTILIIVIAVLVMWALQEWWDGRKP
jgi:hypothetical protein